MLTFALLVLVAATPVLCGDKWPNYPYDIDGVLADGTFLEVEAHTDLTCVLKAVHIFQRKAVCYQKPRCVMPSGKLKKVANASLDWSCLGEEEIPPCDYPFEKVDGAGCFWIVDQNVTFDEAVQSCSANNAYVAVEDHEGKYNALVQYLQQNAASNSYFNDVQMDANGDWRWMGTGTEIPPTGFWGIGLATLTTQRCTIMTINHSYKMDYSDCTAKHGYICQKWAVA